MASTAGATEESSFIVDFGGTCSLARFLFNFNGDHAAAAAVARVCRLHGPTASWYSLDHALFVMRLPDGRAAGPAAALTPSTQVA